MQSASGVVVHDIEEQSSDWASNSPSSHELAGFASVISHRPLADDRCKLYLVCVCFMSTTDWVRPREGHSAPITSPASFHIPSFVGFSMGMGFPQGMWGGVDFPVICHTHEFFGRYLDTLLPHW